MLICFLAPELARCQALAGAVVVGPAAGAGVGEPAERNLLAALAFPERGLAVIVLVALADDPDGHFARPRPSDAARVLLASNGVPPRANMLAIAASASSSL